jgi:hypothetical protein
MTPVQHSRFQAIYISETLYFISFIENLLDLVLN